MSQDCRSEGKYGRSEKSALQVIWVRTAGLRVSTAGRRCQHYRSQGQDCRSEGKYRGLLQVRGISTAGQRVRRVRDGGVSTTREKESTLFFLLLCSMVVTLVVTSSLLMCDVSPNVMPAGGMNHNSHQREWLQGRRHRHESQQPSTGMASIKTSPSWNTTAINRNGFREDVTVMELTS